MQYDFDPGPLFISGEPLYLRLGKIVPQVRLDVQFRKYIKKIFHYCKVLLLAH